MNLEFAKHLAELGKQSADNLRGKGFDNFEKTVSNIFEGYPDEAIFYSGFIHGMSGTEGILKALVKKKSIKQKGMDDFTEIAIVILGHAAELYIVAVDKENKEKFILED